MKARPARGRAMSGQDGLSAGPLHFGGAGARDGRARGLRVLAMSVAIAALAVVGVATGAALTHHGGIGRLLPGAGEPSHPAPPPATRVVHMPHSAVANGADTLAVTLSAPAAYSSPRPTLHPAAAGTWSTVGNQEVFTPASTLEPCSTYTLTVWANTFAKGYSRVGRKHVEQLHVACPPLAGLQQTLARLGYLGARLHPKYAVRLPPRGSESRREAASQAFKPFHGRLEPDPADAPPVEMGTLDETTKGGLEVFQEDHGLTPTGEPDAATWHKLLIVSALYHRNPRPYTWVSVTESLPETLEVHEGDHVALSSPANTGVAGAETAQGIFPIFSRFTSTTMTGTNPDGSHYSDPGVPWVNYFNGGDAVHGFPRGSYGSPQSNGCVELPIDTAARVYPLLAIGDIVWVT